MLNSLLTDHSFQRNKLISHLKRINFGIHIVTQCSDISLKYIFFSLNQPTLYKYLIFNLHGEPIHLLFKCISSTSKWKCQKSLETYLFDELNMKTKRAIFLSLFLSLSLSLSLSFFFSLTGEGVWQ